MVRSFLLVNQEIRIIQSVQLILLSKTDFKLSYLRYSKTMITKTATSSNRAGIGSTSGIKKSNPTVATATNEIEQLMVNLNSSLALQNLV